MIEGSSSRQFRLSLLLALGSVVVAAGAQDSGIDPPDLAKEAQIHRVFKTYNEQPTPDEAWQAVLSKGTTRTYTVQSGDTLWSLGETLFADPKYWPKIWALNSSSVLNPHEIQPEQVIHFVEGTFGEPPSVAVKEAMEPEPTAPVAPEAAVEKAAATAEIVKADGSFIESELPPPGKLSKDLKQLPSSLPDWQPGTEVKKYIFNLQGRDQKSPLLSQPLDYYLADESLEALGEVTETEHGFNAASEQQLIYLKFRAAPTGDHYLIVNEEGSIKDPYKGNSGKMIRIEAEVHLLENVNPKKNIFRAAITRNLTHVMVGSKIVQGEIPLVSTEAVAGPSSVFSQIIGGEFDPDRRLFGPRAIVFINSGAKDGITVGQIFPIYKTVKQRNEDTDVIQNNLLIGQMKVVHAEGKFSTAIITEAAEEIRVGDSTRPQTE